MEHVLSDVLFLTGLTALIVAALGAVMNSGFFDIVIYSNIRFLDLILNRARRPSAYNNEYAQYLMRPRKKYSVRFPVMCGMLCMLLSGISAVLS